MLRIDLVEGGGKDGIGKTCLGATVIIPVRDEDGGPGVVTVWVLRGDQILNLF